MTSQAHHAGRRGPVSSGDKGARQTCICDDLNKTVVVKDRSRVLRFEALDSNKRQLGFSRRVRSKPADAHGALARRDPAKFDASRTTGVWRREIRSSRLCTDARHELSEASQGGWASSAERRRRSAANASGATAHDTRRARDPSDCRSRPRRKTAAPEGAGNRGANHGPHSGNRRRTMMLRGWLQPPAREVRRG